MTQGGTIHSKSVTGGKPEDPRRAVARSRANAREPYFFVSMIAAGLVLLASAWVSSGTMAPYAATLDPTFVRVQPPCDYLTNVDQPHFEAAFRMLQGKPRSLWEGSVMLRRILYFILAFPLMSAWGFDVGGFVTNLILMLAASLAWVIFVRRVIGEQAAMVSMWLLATYPGIAYWVGLPYSYVWIVPGSLLFGMLLWKLATVRRQLSTVLLSLGMGFLSWGYDLLPFFGTAAVLILVRRRRFGELATAILGMGIAMGILILGLNLIFHVPLRNSNTEPYWIILASFTKPIDYAGWWKLVASLPAVFLNNFAFSNFLFLPLLFVALAAISLIGERSIRLETPEAEILLAVLIVFLFNNLAPPYPGWQMRGSWIARLYQPVFVAFLLFVSRSVQRWWNRSRAGYLGRISAALVAVTVVANAAVVWGPLLGLPFASEIYHQFYRHGSAANLQLNLERHGRRPLGICESGRSSR